MVTIVRHDVRVGVLGPDLRKGPATPRLNDAMNRQSTREQHEQRI